MTTCFRSVYKTVTGYDKHKETEANRTEANGTEWGHIRSQRLMLSILFKDRTWKLRCGQIWGVETTCLFAVVFIGQCVQDGKTGSMSWRCEAPVWLSLI